MVNRRFALSSKLLAACGIALAAPAHAQLADVQAEPEQAAIPEVVVTAQRTSALASKTPVAMSVLSGAQLIDADLTQPSNLADRLPDVHLDGAADGLKITIRGVSNADTTGKGDPSAAFMLDGIYIARPQFQNLSFYDLDRIEVLRGPQGTLYGRNTTAGVINVISNAPTQRFEGSVSTDWGNYASRQDSAMLNVPVNDVLALRAAVAYNAHNSYLNNGQGTPYHLGLDRNDSSGRLSARLAFSNTVSLLLRVDHSSVRDNSDDIVPDTNFFHGVASGNPVWYGAPTSARLTNGFVPPNTRPEQGYGHKDSSGISADFSWNLGAVTVSYLGSHRHSDQDFLENYYYRIAPAYAIGVHESFGGNYGQNSHELRIASNGGGPLTAQGGLYYFREESNEDFTFRDLEPLGLPPYYVFPTGPTISLSKAAFAQATYGLTDRLRLTAGARFTHDAKSRIGSTNFQQASTFNPATDFQLLNAAEITTHKSTWRLGAEFDLAPATLLYGTVSTGYKAGGFNDGCLAGSHALGIACPAALAVPAATLYYQPETLTSYEAGVKTAFWDKKASLNVTAFDYDYRNLQLSGVAVVQGAPRYVTSNAGVASVKGLELEGLVYPTLDDKFNYSLTLLDAHYVSYSPDGVHSWDGYKLDRAPSNVLSLGYEHRFRLGGGDLKAGFISRKSSAYSIGVPSQLLQYRIPSRTQTDATLNYHRDGAAWRLQASVRNLENKVVPINIDSFGMVVPSDPRTVDVRFTYQF
jgi:iron complex outermembrane receptor protein